jgi:hypothetical protein
MRTRLATLAALGGIAVAVLPAHAATPKPQITDPSGDQFPASSAATDITGITLQTVFKKKVVRRVVTLVPTASKVTLSLAAAPDTNTWYMVEYASSGACKDVSLYYNADPVPLYAQNRAVCQDTTPGTTIEGPAGVVKGKTIVWTLPLTAFPVGTSFSEIGGSTTTGAVPSLTLDGTDESSATFTVGQK